MYIHLHMSYTVWSNYSKMIAIIGMTTGVLFSFD